ncbi:MAG: hypothetical protein ACJ768_14515 [Gaiellaceae bacterium]
MGRDIYVVASPDASVFHWFLDCPALEMSTHEVLVETMDGIAPQAITESHGLLPLCRRCEDALARRVPRDEWAESLETQGPRSLQTVDGDSAAPREWAKGNARLVLYPDRVELITPPLLWGDPSVEVIPLDAILDMSTERWVPLLQDARIVITAAVDDDTEATTSFAFERGVDPDEVLAVIEAARYALIGSLPPPGAAEFARGFRKLRESAVGDLHAARGQAGGSAPASAMRAMSVEEDDVPPVAAWVLDVPAWSGSLSAEDVLPAVPDEDGWYWTFDIAMEVEFSLSPSSDPGDGYSMEWSGPATGSVQGKYRWEEVDCGHSIWTVNASGTGTATLSADAATGVYSLWFDLPEVPATAEYTFYDGSTETDDETDDSLFVLGDIDLPIPEDRGPFTHDHVEELPSWWGQGTRALHQKWQITPGGGGGGGKGDWQFDHKSEGYEPDIDRDNPAWNFRRGHRPNDPDQWSTYAENWINGQAKREYWPALKNTYRWFKARQEDQVDSLSDDEAILVEAFIRQARAKLLQFGKGVD